MKSFEEDAVFGWTLSDPAFVVGSSVLPARFQFISEGPEEVALDDVVPGIDGAFT